MPNKRIFYAALGLGFATVGSNTFTNAKGVQSCGIDTKFNLEQVYELGQLAIYENAENIPDISVTVDKVLDGAALLWHLGTKGATAATLIGRSNIKSTIGLSIYSDQQSSASGTPVSQVTLSGVFPSQVSYSFQINGPATESVTFVGNNKTWLNTFTPSAYLNTDVPIGSGGTQRREDLMFGSGTPYCILPKEIYGVAANGQMVTQLDGSFPAHLQSIKTSTNLGREQLFELGRRGVFHRYVSFPVEVRTDIEVISIAGDRVEAYEDTPTTTDQQIVLKTRDGMVIDLGVKNRISGVTFGGATAGGNGGNATDTYSYSNFNDFTVTHPQDPSLL
jgi:hypothetical protein